jgi:hypothetical protein
LKRLQENADEETEKDDAIRVIKKYWRATMERIKVQEMREEELIFLGMKREEGTLTADPLISKQDIFDHICERHADADEPRSELGKL